MAEPKVIIGEEVRDELTIIRGKLKALPLGDLIHVLSNYSAYQGRAETDIEIFENPNY